MFITTQYCDSLAIKDIPLGIKAKGGEESPVFIFQIEQSRNEFCYFKTCYPVMLCQYYMILHAGCAHVAFFTASHILPNCGEGQGWMLKYEDRKCLNCEDHDFCCKNAGPEPSLDGQLEKEEEIVCQLEASHLQFPKVNRVKLNNELAESLDRRFFQVREDES